MQNMLDTPLPRSSALCCLYSFQKLIFSTAAKIFSSTSRIKTDGEGVGFLNPLLAMAQIVNVARPGYEPDVQQEVAEDVRLLCSSLADKRGTHW
jgi:hypothetical protein